MRLLSQAVPFALSFILGLTLFQLVLADPDSPSGPASSTPIDFIDTTSNTNISSARSTGHSTTVELDVASINPALILSPQDVSNAISHGEEDVKKGRPVTNFFPRLETGFKCVRGNRQTVETSVAICQGLDGSPVYFASYDSATKYEPLSLPQDIVQNGAYVKALDFVVALSSKPVVGPTDASAISQIASAIAIIAHPNQSAQINAITNHDTEVKQQADANDVVIIKFVISDDQGHNYNAVPEVITYPYIPETALLTASQTSVTISSAEVRYTQTVEQPSTQEHPFYVSCFNLYFPTFDENGKCRIDKDAKKLYLRAITPNGEYDATFKLDKPKF